MKATLPRSQRGRPPPAAQSRTGNLRPVPGPTVPDDPNGRSSCPCNAVPDEWRCDPRAGRQQVLKDPEVHQPDRHSRRPERAQPHEQRTGSGTSPVVQRSRSSAQSACPGRVQHRRHEECPATEPACRPLIVGSTNTASPATDLAHSRRRVRWGAKSGSATGAPAFDVGLATCRKARRGLQGSAGRQPDPARAWRHCQRLANTRLGLYAPTHPVALAGRRSPARAELPGARLRG